MKTTTGPLLAHMRGNTTFTLTDLYTITLNSGLVLRFADYDIDIVTGGNTYLATGPGFKRGKTRIVIGLEVDTLDVEIYPKISDTVAGLSMLAAAVAGVFDGAYLQLDRAYITGNTTVVGTLNMFSGRFADIDASRGGGIKVRVNSDVAALNISMPRNLYSAACSHALFDAGCKLARSATNNTVTGATTTTISNTLAQAAGYFDRGYLVFTSGALNGTRRTVKSYSSNSVTIFNPLPAAPSAGDTFAIYPGCDKAMATCSSKFSNLVNFKGFPFIPQPETVT